MKTVLITGAYGFLGRHVARYMSDKGYAVVGIGHGDWSQSDYRQYGLKEWHIADVTLESLKHYAGTPDIVIHCAGSGSVAFSVEQPQQDFQRTVVSTSAVLEFVRLCCPHARLVYPSSAAVYGNAIHLPINEMHKLEPVSPYGLHKQMAEDLCKLYAKSFDISIAIVRLFSVYGEGLEKQLLWDACKKIVSGECVFFGTGAETRDWLNVNDASSLLVKATEIASPSCPIANGGYGVGATVNQVLSELFKQFKLSDQPVFSGMSRGGDPTHYVADIEIAKSWGWLPQTRLEDGLKQYVEWFKGIESD